MAPGAAGKVDRPGTFRYSRTMGLGVLSGLLGVIALSLGVEAAALPGSARDIESELGQARGSSLVVAFVVSSSAEEAWAARSAAILAALDPTTGRSCRADQSP
jgi:hypothetical protein